jgi:hypothetical protein
MDPNDFDETPSDHLIREPLSGVIYPELSHSIIGAAIKVLNTLKPGLNEKAYENALVIELKKRTDLRRCIAAMVAEEDDPIPLTWLVQLVRKTGYHPTLERGDVLRRRSSWRQSSDFPDQMILWRE